MNNWKTYLILRKRMQIQTDKKGIRPGDKIGRWTVTEEYRLTDRKERKWLCRCECGTERYVLERSLIYGGSTSCGCLRKERAEKANSPDLTGKQFGQLQVLHKLDSTENGATRWLCKCSCGSEYAVLGTLLTTGRRTRCSGKVHQKNYSRRPRPSFPQRRSRPQSRQSQ